MNSKKIQALQIKHEKILLNLIKKLSVNWQNKSLIKYYEKKVIDKIFVRERPSDCRDPSNSIVVCFTDETKLEFYFEQAWSKNRLVSFKGDVQKFKKLSLVSLNIKRSQKFDKKIGLYKTFTTLTLKTEKDVIEAVWLVTTLTHASEEICWCFHPKEGWRTSSSVIDSLESYYKTED